MNFEQGRKLLQQIFQQHDFTENVRKNKRHVSQIVVERCSDGTEILISFPGYKARIIPGGVIFDYRVDLKREGFASSLSHANIITDIYNKIMYGNMKGVNMRQALIDFFREGRMEPDFRAGRLCYTSIAPHSSLLDRVQGAHGRKSYNRQGNARDLTLEELFCSLKWIVLQEDINYPMEKGFEGRKMSLARYLETIFITENQRYTLENVISRALSHSRPVLWTEMHYPFKTR